MKIPNEYLVKEEFTPLQLLIKESSWARVDYNYKIIITYKKGDSKIEVYDMTCKKVSSYNSKNSNFNYNIDLLEKIYETKSYLK